MDGYLMVLGKYPEDDIVAAIRESLDVCSYFPKPAEIIEIVKSISTNRRMIGGIEDIPELDCHERDEVTELLEEFRQKMKWGD